MFLLCVKVKTKTSSLNNRNILHPGYLYIRRLEETGTIEVKGTVEKIRSQRAYSIQMPDQYVFCHLALLEYALHNGKLVEVDLTGFEEDGSESD